jgi:hypothetical protein
VVASSRALDELVVVVILFNLAGKDAVVGAARL